MIITLRMVTEKTRERILAATATIADPSRTTKVMERRAAVRGRLGSRAPTRAALYVFGRSQSVVLPEHASPTKTQIRCHI